MKSDFRSNGKNDFRSNRWSASHCSGKEGSWRTHLRWKRTRRSLVGSGLGQ